MVDILCVQGPSKVSGTISVSGSKNASLPILAACILSKGKITLEKIPHLDDVTTLIELLSVLGLKFVILDSNSLEVDASNITNLVAPCSLVRAMRASFLVLGPLLAREGRAQVALPGGCAIGSRPVDMHIFGLQQLGANIIIKDGYVEACAPNGLIGANIKFTTPSVTATENIIMAAVLAKGKTTIEGAAKEPEIDDLINFLNQAGAKISGSGTDIIEIQGVDELTKTVNYSVMADRIEAGTFLIAAAMTKGNITINNINPLILSKPLECLEKAGAAINVGDNFISLDMQGATPKAVDITTAPYPGFPTDLQAQWLALNAVALGSSIICENVFENRFMHVKEMCSMGAKLVINGQHVFSEGSSKLKACQVAATDLRASAGLLLAALVSEGVTTIKNVYHIDRGYENIEGKFTALGCNVRRSSLAMDTVQ